ncbi:hypothetical protein [uncultured Hyphomonas sp.]|uniref:hypothetical protein n=1 Tax=uncultured Hyphomonas sp. TaxID=225298 RepID=UPI0030D76B26
MGGDDAVGIGGRDRAEGILAAVADGMALARGAPGRAEGGTAAGIDGGIPG